VERVEEGTQLVDRAGNTMTDVVHAIKRVTDIMGDISEASEEQSRGVAQVSQAITQMDQATSQNAALVADSATAAQALRAQAHELVQSVSAFRLAGAAADVPPHHQAVQPASAAAERQQPQASGRKAQRPANTPRADTAALLATAGAEDGWSAF
jgi:methyl-accepting chemotaxis protein